MTKLLQFGEDSRLRGYSGRVTHPVLALERTYCANCGRPWGWASQESSAHIAAAEIVVLCEECFEALNASPVAQGASSRQSGQQPDSPAGVAALSYKRIPPNEMTSLGLVEENTRSMQ